MAAKKNTKKEKGVISVEFSTKIRDNFMRYAREVISDRALPEVSTGLKPVQQRILQAALDLGLTSTAAFKKSVRTVGQTLAVYHPHGDQSVYDAMIVMGQPFKQNCPLLEISGNCGNQNGDPAAAMRYTEARLSPIGDIMLRDIKKNTVDMIPNYDESETEAQVLPSLFPNLLINGNEGIAVGCACSFLPHNPRDVYKVLDLIVKNMINDKDTSIDSIIGILQAPDFPTGGVIVGSEGYLEGYRNGKSTVTLRATYEIEERNKKTVIVFTEIPYQTKKSSIMLKIGELIRDKVIEGISEVKDLSAKGKIRIEVYLKKDANAQYVLNKLFKHTELKTSLSMNHVALVEGNPVQRIDIRNLFTYFLEHVYSVVSRRVEFDKNDVDKRVHILESLMRILESEKNRKAAIKIIESEKTEQGAISKIQETFELDGIQAEYIIDQKIRSLNPERITKIRSDFDKLLDRQKELQGLLDDNVLMLKQIRLELSDIAKMFFKCERKTQIAFDESTRDIDMRELVEEKDVVITLTARGLVKSMDMADTVVQNRNGKGNNMKLHDGDYPRVIVTANIKDDLLVVTNLGKGYLLPVYKIPIVSKASVGKYIANYVPIIDGEEIVALLPIKQEENDDLLLVTANGIGKRLSIANIPKMSTGGRIVKIHDNDKLVAANLVNDNDSILLATAEGLALKTSVSNVSHLGRAAAGNILMRFKTETDRIVSAINVKKDMKLVVVTKFGIGKRLEPELIAGRSNRGGKGMIYYKPTTETGQVVSVLTVDDKDTVFIGTISNQVIRIRACDIRETGRTGKGVSLIRLTENDSVISVSSAPEEEVETDADS